MRTPLIVTCVIAVLALFAWRLSASGNSPKRTPAEAAALIAADKAVLVDVRELAEWTESGVAAPAHTLALSDLRANREAWKPFLEANREKELILYCRSGNRSGQAAAILAAEGFTVSNAGAFSDWKGADLPVRTVDEPRR